jgi:flagellar basal-body rod protein FlgG
MMNALYSAATGMSAMQMGMDVIANNLANVNTTGYKATTITFEDLLYQSLGDSYSARQGAQVGMGVGPGNTHKVFTSGEMKETGVWSNMAIEGNGFFMVTLPDGTVGYTRDGSFTVDATGTFVNSSGHRLYDGYSSSIAVPQEVDPSTVRISPNGQINGKLDGQDILLGQLSLATFVNPAGLSSVGNNIYVATNNSGPATVVDPGQGGTGTIKQGVVEGSNVSVMTEMIDMITAQRAFESVSKAISTSDEMLGMANSMRR